MAIFDKTEHGHTLPHPGAGGFKGRPANQPIAGSGKPYPAFRETFATGEAA
jgi:hypothetical protein